jgi:probable addiction module antidote protein
MSQLARDTGLTREGLYKALSSDGNPTFATIAKVTKALGLQITVQAAH